jgi:hypothetical protein
VRRGRVRRIAGQQALTCLGSTADRQGLALRKSRTRDPRALDYDRWMIVSLVPGRPDVGAGPTGKPSMTLDEVEANLMGDDA